MRETETGALGRFVRSGRESVCLVRPRGDALVLETLFLAEDVYSQAEIEEAVVATETKDAELDLARQIVQGLAGPFEPELLTSAYRRDLRALLDAKSRGESISQAPPEAEPAPMGDLLEALKASVEAAKASAGPKARRAAKKASSAADGVSAQPTAKKAPRRGATKR
jgi:DNA end-binding protein Ku